MVAAYGFWVGYSKGIISTAFSVLALLFGLIAAVKFGPTMTDLLLGLFPDGGSFMLLAGVIVTFFLTMALFRFVARALEGALESININFINQILGGILSGLFFIFIFSTMLMFANRSGLISEETKAQSVTFVVLEPFPENAWALGRQAWPWVEEFYDYALDLMDNLKDGVDKGESDQVWDIEDDGTSY